MKKIIISFCSLSCPPDAQLQDLSPFLDEACVDFSPVDLHCLDFTRFTICKIPRFTAEEEPNKHPDDLDPFTT